MIEFDNEFKDITTEDLETEISDFVAKPEEIDAYLREFAEKKIARVKEHAKVEFEEDEIDKPLTIAEEITETFKNFLDDTEIQAVPYHDQEQTKGQFKEQLLEEAMAIQGKIAAKMMKEDPVFNMLGMIKERVAEDGFEINCENCDEEDCMGRDLMEGF